MVLKSEKRNVSIYIFHAHATILLKKQNSLKFRLQDSYYRILLRKMASELIGKSLTKFKDIKNFNLFFYINLSFFSSLDTI